MNLKKRIAAIGMVVVLLVGLIPMGVMTSVSAAESGYKAIMVDKTQIYFYGADTIEKPVLLENQEQYEISYTCQSEQICSVYENGILAEISEPEAIILENGRVILKKEWLEEADRGWILIKCNGDDLGETISEPGVQVDSEAPKITNVAGNPGEWTNTPIDLTLTANDFPETGGVGVIAYRMGEGEWKTGEGANVFKISQNGNYEFYAKDAVGNVSEAFSVTVDKIDMEKPEIDSITIDPDTWTNEAVTVTVNARDGESEELEYKMDEGKWQTENQFQVKDAEMHTYYVKDKAGNEVSEQKAAEKYDKKKPTIKNVEISYRMLFLKKRVTWDDSVQSDKKYIFEVDASDDESGVKDYSLDKETWQESNEFELYGGGNYTFYVRDYAGNIEEYSNELEEDMSAPVIKKIGISLDKKNTWVDFDTMDDDAEVILNNENSKPTNQSVFFKVSQMEDNRGKYGMVAISDTFISKEDDVQWSDKDERQFEIKDCKEHYIYAKDNTVPANISRPYKIQAANFNDTPPEITAVTGKPEQWTNKPVTLTVQSGSVFNEAGTEFKIAGYRKDGDKEYQTDNKFTIEDCKTHKFYAKDEAGNESAAYEIAIEKYDAKAPQLKSGNTKSIHFQQKNSGRLAKLANTLTFGNFFNERLEVTVDAKDEKNETSNASGIKGYTFIFQNTEGEEKQFQSVNGTIKIEKEKIENFKGKVYVVLEDNAGNKSDRIQVTTGNSNLKNVNEWFDGNLMIENDAPVITHITPGKKSIQTKDYNIQFQVKDITKKHYSGIANVTVEVNGMEVMNKNATALTSEDAYSLKVNAKKKSVNGVTIKDWNKGKLNIVINAYDNAGNVAVQKETLFYFDQTAPVIKDFDFDLTSNIDVEKGTDGYTSVKDSVEVTPYGFYFKKSVKVTISAKDEQYQDEALASGLQSITVYLKDAENGKLYIVPKNGAKIKAVDSIKEAKAITTKEQISFIIPANFKGQIYAYATDMVGNTPADCVHCIDKNIDNNGYVHPNGTIIESVNKHKETSAIQFDMPKTSQTQNTSYRYSYEGASKEDAKMDYDKSQKVPLYSTDIQCGIKVSDTYSGIREVKWTVIEGEQKTIKTIAIDSEGTMSGDTDGWKSKSEKNLITTLENTSFTISGNYNDMVLVVELTDRAGNRSYDYYVFGIDKTAPVIDVEYNNNEEENTYFKAGRTAVVTISERNFNADKINLTVTKDGAEYEVKQDWKNGKGTGNGDNTRHTFHIDYTEEGDYTFHIGYTDRAKNKNQAVNYHESVAPEQFTVDTTAPQIQVSYDNNNAQNEKYFNQNRTATVVITEHNFDENRIQLTQTAALDGGAIATPTVSWNSQGDVHTAVISYQTDGDYTFDISLEDMAGNPSTGADYGSSVAAKEFTIDTNIAKPVITGVENGKSYKDEVIPTISFDDVNFNMDEVQLLRTRKNEQNVDVTQKFINGVTREAHGGSGASDTFEKKMENDGIYTLNVRMTDMAGNEESESVTFTVNRFGSVYTYNDYLTSLQDKYVKKIKDDVVITEYNPNRLMEDSLKVQITKDGTPLTNVKCTVNPMVNEFVSVGESGWYQYEYTIDRDNFKKDGIYKITIASQDAAGNKPETTNYEDGDIIFRVDKTPAEITSIKGMENQVVNAQKQKVEFEVFDAIGLKKIDVHVGDKVVKTFEKFENLTNYSGSFDLKEGANQKVRLVVEDIAGNVTDTDAKDFAPEFPFQNKITVSTNFFIRWYANKVAFWGSIGGVTAVMAAAGSGVYFRRKKKVG